MPKWDTYTSINAGVARRSQGAVCHRSSSKRMKDEQGAFLDGHDCLDSLQLV